ncbi:hypothetical protein QAD02_010821 [Eretmocerus hayati]|uniref:Uncharacterized protein n=1 Tax=Eretmocerus hayati TaxID=131215 RepID=A0ACC2NV12_9HYME|nr:hypothetical protein QAD02_010821 [Eretmocerus hayati]
MDFGQLISVARKNEHRTERKNFYPANLAPPKKEAKQTNKSLSENVRKFIAKKEEEERRKALEAQRKKENLLALRDQKTQNRINKHLKVCKAANKSVLDDAVDPENTAVTLAGPSQCDEDDYGYVSQEASAFYNKLMNKYSSLPPEKPLFSNDGKKVIKDIASTKDRVKEALRQQQLEESMPHKRKRKRRDSETDGQRSRDGESQDDEEDSRKHSDAQETESKEKPRPKKRPMPPPIDFNQLLQLAEKKQHEPIKIEVKPKEEPERLMTKKQMKEYSKEKEWRERKEQRLRNPESAKPSQSSADVNKSSKSPLPYKSENMKTPIDRSNEKTDIRKLPTIAKKTGDRPLEKVSTSSKPIDRNNGVNKIAEKSSSSVKPKEKNISLNKSTDRVNTPSRPSEKSNGMNGKTTSVKALERDAIAEERRKLEEERRKFEEMRRSFEEEKKKLLMMKSKKPEESRPSQSSSQKSTPSKVPDRPKSSSSGSSSSSKPTSSNGSYSSKSKPNPSEVKSRPFPPADVKSRQFPPADVRPRQFPPADVRPRQFPPPDVRSSKPKSKLKIDPHRRRIYDDSDEEYDSELDDFIDDGPQDDGEDISKHISEIFGYDRNKYRDIDDDDDLAMESNFREVLKEEFESTKQGMMEDLADMRLEKLQNQRKKLAMMKKKR